MRLEGEERREKVEDARRNIEQQDKMFLALNEISRKESTLLESLMQPPGPKLLSSREEAPVAKKISQAFLAKYIHD